MSTDANDSGSNTIETGLDVILVLLYASGVTGQSPESIQGITRLQKLLFLLWKEGAFYEVIPNPYDRHVLEAGDRLLCFGNLEEMRGMIPSRRKRGRKVKRLPKEPIHDVPSEG